MHIYIDFDDTLIHTSRMRDDVYTAFGLLPPEEIKRHYADFRKKEPFSIQGFSAYLQKHEVDGERLRELFYDHANRSSTYVFNDATEFLTTLKSQGHDLTLLTFDVEPGQWQKPKIQNSGLAHLFDQVHIEDKKKVDYLQSLNLTEPFIFIDDKQSEIDAVQEAFPQAICLKHEPGSPLSVHLNHLP